MREERGSGIEVPELSELNATLEIAEKEKAAQAEPDLEESGTKSELQDEGNIKYEDRDPEKEKGQAGLP